MKTNYNSLCFRCCCPTYYYYFQVDGVFFFSFNLLVAYESSLTMFPMFCSIKMYLPRSLSLKPIMIKCVFLALCYSFLTLYDNSLALTCEMPSIGRYLCPPPIPPPALPPLCLLVGLISSIYCMLRMFASIYQAFH